MWFHLRESFSGHLLSTLGGVIDPIQIIKNHHCRPNYRLRKFWKIWIHRFIEKFISLFNYRNFPKIYLIDQMSSSESRKYYKRLKVGESNSFRSNVERSSDVVPKYQHPIHSVNLMYDYESPKVTFYGLLWVNRTLFFIFNNRNF